jgi:hypothetical protein
VQVSEYIRSLRMGSNAAIRPPWMKVEQSMPREEHSEESLVPEGSPRERFPDELAKWLASVMSRRQALRWFGGTLGSAMLARFADPASAAQQNTQGAAAAGGTSIPTKHGAPLRGIELVKKDRSLEGRFGLMFKNLPPFEPPDKLLNGLAETMAEVGAANNPLILAGFTFLGQFIDHDLTLGRSIQPRCHSSTGTRTLSRTSARHATTSTRSTAAVRQRAPNSTIQLTLTSC